MVLLGRFLVNMLLVEGRYIQSMRWATLYLFLLGADGGDVESADGKGDGINPDWVRSRSAPA